MSLVIMKLPLFFFLFFWALLGSMSPLFLLNVQVVWGRGSLFKFYCLVSQAFCNFALPLVHRSIPVGGEGKGHQVLSSRLPYRKIADGGYSLLNCPC